MDASNQDSNDRVLTAVRLGWLTVEAFGRLRRYVRAAGRGRPAQADAARRFRFSDRSLSRRDELLLAMDQLEHTAAQLVPDLKPTLPHSPEELEQFLEGADLDAVHNQFDDWSKQVWVALAAEDELVGRSFTFGGSLADTYWFVDGRRGEDPDQALGQMLRKQRLEYTADRFDRIGDHLSPHVADVLHSTLYAWRIGDQVNDLDTEGKKRVVQRLEAQAGVWYDLLFGRRSAGSYLTPRDRRQVSWGAFAATVLLVLAVSVLAWLGVLILASAGRSLLAAASPWREQVTAASAEMVSKLLTWQNLSALAATLSSVVVVLLGLVSRASGWIILFHDRAKEWLKLRAICRRAYRHWGD